MDRDPVNRPSTEDEQKPKTSVSWSLARDFCQRIGCELPTEARWEFAARAGQQDAYTWGSAPEDGRDRGNFFDESRTTRGTEQNGLGKRFPFEDGFASLAPVARFQPSRIGFYDLIGNAAEWCADSYHDEYELLGEDDPVGHRENGFRSYRGGSYGMGIEWSRVAKRHQGKDSPTGSRADLGFRPMRRLP